MDEVLVTLLTSVIAIQIIVESSVKRQVVITLLQIVRMFVMDMELVRPLIIVPVTVVMVHRILANIQFVEDI